MVLAVCCVLCCLFLCVCFVLLGVFVYCGCSVCMFRVLVRVCLCFVFGVGVGIVGVLFYFLPKTDCWCVLLKVGGPGLVFRLSVC